MSYRSMAVTARIVPVQQARRALACRPKEGQREDYASQIAAQGASKSVPPIGRIEPTLTSFRLAILGLTGRMFSAAG
jgi:hypothetical protein